MVKISKLKGISKKKKSYLTIRAKDPIKQTLIRKAGVRALKSGTHPQPWRNTKFNGAFAQLGKMGALGDDLIFYIDIDLIKINNLTKKGININISDITRDFKSDVLSELVLFLINRINIKVPNRSGNLQKSLRKSLTSTGGSKDDKFPFIIIINTEGIAYAGPVNNMPSKNLQHSQDPNAEKNWYNFLLLKGRPRAKTLLNQFIQNISNSLPKIGPIIGKRGNNFTIIRSLFTVSYN